MYFFGSYMSGSPSKYSPPQSTHLSKRCFEIVLVRFLCDDFQLLRRICLNLRNRLKSSSFEGFLKFWEQKKSQ